MKYTIEEHEEFIKEYDYVCLESEHLADLLAEVKQLRETYKRLDGHECLYWRSQHAEVEARLADAVACLEEVYLYGTGEPNNQAKLAGDCLARISGASAEVE